MTLVDVSSLNDDEDGAEEDDVAIDIDDHKSEDFATGSLLIHWDEAATMMDVPPPLLTRCPPPRRGLPLHPWWHPPTVACVMVSRGAVMNVVDVNGLAAEVITASTTTTTTTTTMTTTTMTIDVDGARLRILLRRQRLTTAIIGGIGSP